MLAMCARVQIWVANQQSKGPDRLSSKKEKGAVLLSPTSRKAKILSALAG